MMPGSKSKIEQLARSFCVRAIVSLGLLIGPILCAEAAPKKCVCEDARKAEIEASSLKTWHDVFNSYMRYRNCDNGAIGEGYSNSVASLLANRWDEVEELTTLSHAYPKFTAFVLSHVDETMTSDQGEAIKKNIRSNCPTAVAKLCESIKRRFAALGSP